MRLPYTPGALYHLALFLYPEGVKNGDSLDIRINGRQMELRMAVKRGKGIEFLLHLPETIYARKVLYFWSDGSGYRDVTDSIPEHDRLPDERPLTELNADLALRIYERLIEDCGEQLAARKNDVL